MGDRQLPEMYMHYKGPVYLLVRIAHHHERHDELWAIYRPVEGEESMLFVRPMAEFDAEVELDTPDGKVKLPRFRQLTPQEGEQVAINRLRQQVERAQEQAGDDPHEQMVINLVSNTIEKLQERLREASEQ